MAELNSKVGTNTEAIAQIVPSIEGMRAAVALAGGQYKMFADNMEIFENKAGSSAEAFAAQAENLDKQIASLPDTFNKISIQVGESAKNILTLNGTLTPLLASFNNMDESTQKLIADLTLLAGGYVTVKGAVAAINTIKTIQLALQAKATAATAADTVATGANTTALNAQNTALAQQIALLNQRTAAVAAGRNIPAQAATLSDLENAGTNLQYAETRFQQHQMNRYQQLLQRQGTQDLRTPQQMAMEAELARTAASQRAYTEELRRTNRVIPGINRSFQTLYLESKGISTGLNSGVSAMARFGNGLRNVTGLLTGGMTGLAGFANALGTVGLAISSAVVGFQTGRWLSKKIGDITQEAFGTRFDIQQSIDDWFWEKIYGLESGSIEKQRQLEAKAEREALERAAKDQEKAAKDQLIAAENQKKTAALKSLNETVDKYKYSKLTIEDKIKHDIGRIGAINSAYNIAESKGNTVRMDELLKEKVNLLEKIKSNEEKLKDVQLELNNIYNEQSLSAADSMKRISIYKEQLKRFQNELEYANKINLAGREPEKYIKILNNYNSALENLWKEKEDAERKELEYTKDSLSYEKSIYKRRLQYQDYFDKAKKIFDETKDQNDKEKAINQMIWAQREINNVKMKTDNFAKGLATAFQAVEYGTAQAAQAESRRYYKSQADEYARKNTENTTEIRKRLSAMAEYEKEAIKVLKEIIKKNEDGQIVPI